ncbi:MAG TPA: amidohydrolase family protein [Thermoanaerobaculia bacterium]
MRRLLFLFTLMATTAFAADEVVAIRAARLIDGTGAAPVQNGVVIVTGNRITAAGSNVAIPRGARVIDLGDATLLPGFIDTHTHLFGRELGEPGWNESSVRDFPAYGAIRGVANAQKTLQAGITSVRNVGTSDFNDIALRRAIDEGHITGPRIQAAGYSLGITGGHCDDNGYRPGVLESGYREGIANGVDDVRAAVRYMIKYGADAIKTCATGGVLSEGDAVGSPQYDYDELKAMVDEAHKHERKVAAHAHGTEGIKIAVRAGVASIEHGSFLDEEGAKLMAQRGTYLVPTLSALERVEQAAKSNVLTGLRKEKALSAAEAGRRALKIAVANGVPVAMGTDAGVGPHGANMRELLLMVDWGGMRPLDAITASTIGAARLLGWEKRVGSLEAGKLADVIAVAGDPVQDIRRVEQVVFVMKDGKVVRGQGSGPGAQGSGPAAR